MYLLRWWWACIENKGSFLETSWRRLAQDLRYLLTSEASLLSLALEPRTGLQIIHIDCNFSDHKISSANCAHQFIAQLNNHGLSKEPGPTSKPKQEGQGVASSNTWSQHITKARSYCIIYIGRSQKYIPTYHQRQRCLYHDPSPS